LAAGWITTSAPLARELIDLRRRERVRVTHDDARLIAERLGLQCPAVGGDHQLRRTAEQAIYVWARGHVTVGDDKGNDHARTSSG
jgi:hypothetical protein